MKELKTKNAREILWNKSNFGPNNVGSNKRFVDIDDLIDDYLKRDLFFILRDGKYYYFDNYKKSTVTDSTGKKKQIDIPKQVDDLKVSKDFNCLIWYMKHIASFREVWGQQPNAKDKRTNDIENDDTYWNDKKKKCRKGAGIVTLEYNVRPEGLRNAEGYGMSSGEASYAGLQTPYGECLHVFLGNVKEKSNKEGNEQQNLYDVATQKLVTANEQISIAEKAIEDIKKQQKKYWNFKNAWI